MKKNIQKIKDFLIDAFLWTIIVLCCIIIALQALYDFFCKKIVKEYAAIIGTFIFFFLSAQIIRKIDPTAGTYDAGVLQIINLSFVMVAVFNTAGWSIFCTLWPDLKQFMKTEFTSSFNKLTLWEKFKLCLSVLFFVQLELLLASIIVR